MLADQNPDIPCELMDGRDNFLTLCRENHYEFSSRRRAQFSTMMMLYHIATSDSSEGYVCDMCQQGLPAVEPRYHCVGGCEDYDLCQACHDKHGHEHAMSQVGVVVSQSGVSQKHAYEQAAGLLEHAITCTTVPCPNKQCDRVKAVIRHCQGCAKSPRECKQCGSYTQILSFHSMRCRTASPSRRQTFSSARSKTIR